ncbi:MAG: DUF3344 domain-containing protein [Methanoregula sp.]
MKTTRTESRLGRFSYLLKGRAKPRRSYALMIALVFVALLSLAGVVSADPYYKGELLATNTGISGTIYGDVWFQGADTWATSDNPVNDSASVTFTNIPATGNNVEWARLYVVVYMGNMTANYYGNETITFGGTTLATAQPLHLAYDRTVGANITNPGGNFVELNRVTSDYVNVFDVTSLITSTSITANIQTWNESNSDFQAGFGRFDGRIKTATLVIGYKDGRTTPTKYWVNEGHDTVTYNWTNPQYVSNTTFDTSTIPKLWTNANMTAIYLATADGAYTFDPVSTTTTTLTNPIAHFTPPANHYYGFNTWNVTSRGSAGVNSIFTYNRTGNYYKIPLAILTMNDPTRIYDFSGNYAGKPGTNEWAYGNEIDNSDPNSATVFPYTTDITTASGIKYLADGDVTLIQAPNMNRYAAKSLNYTINEPKDNIVNMSLTLNVSGQRSGAQGFKVWVWNQRTSIWDGMYTSPSDVNYHYITIDLVPASDYVDSNGNVKVLIIQNGRKTSLVPSRIYNDYDRLTVTDP